MAGVIQEQLVGEEGFLLLVYFVLFTFKFFSFNIFFKTVRPSTGFGD